MKSQEVFHYNAIDLEGTAVDLESFHQLAFEEVARDYGVVFGPEEFRQFVGAGDKVISESIAAILEISPTMIREEKNGVYRALLRSHPIVSREGIFEYLDEIRRSGGELVLASITPDADAIEILRRSELWQFFNPDRILTESKVKRLKPDPEVYLEAATLLGISTTPDRMIVHEDSPPGIESGKRAGAKVAAFPVHKRLVFNIEPDAVFKTWKGVTPQLVYDKVMSTGNI